MKQKDYYAILGVTRAESAGGIRAAYRKLARIHHPDHAGPGRTRRFQEINEAYRVLSDPAARKSYNESLTRKKNVSGHKPHPGNPFPPGGRRHDRHSFAGFPNNTDPNNTDRKVSSPGFSAACMEPVSRKRHSRGPSRSK